MTTTETMTTGCTVDCASAETAPEVARPLPDDQVPLVAELIAYALTSNHLIDGHYIRLHALLDDSGAIALTIAGAGDDFLADDILRVLLRISDPITVVPVTGDPSTEIGAPA